MEVDHVLPRSLLKDPNRKFEILRQYGLEEDFEIDGYGNLLPCCRECNINKSDTVFRPSPKILSKLELARSNAEKVEEHIARSVSDTQIARLLNEIERAFKVGRGDILASSLAKHVAQSNLVPQESISIEAGDVTVCFSANSSDVISRKVSDYRAEDETHIVSVYSSIGEIHYTIDEDGNNTAMTYSSNSGTVIGSNGIPEFLHSLSQIGPIGHLEEPPKRAVWKAL